jgi:hypothetical protein
MTDNGKDLETEPEEKVTGPTPFEEPPKKKRSISPLGLLAILALCPVLAALIVPHFTRARSRGSLTACKSSLKNLGTAMEMYSSDWEGSYPTSLALLTPNYLKTLPECPRAGSVTYQLKTGQTVYNSPGFTDYYFLQCAGTHHTNVSLPPGYPQYDGISGLLER